MKKLLVLVFLFVALDTFAQENLGTGQWLYKLWQSAKAMDSGLDADMTDQNLANGELYLGFIWGVETTLEKMKIIALPGNFTSTATIENIIGDYLESHPEQRGEEAVLLVSRALIQVYASKPESPDTSKFK